VFDPLRYSTGAFNNCSPKGKDGDSYLSSLKNRDVPPARTERYSVGRLMKVVPTDLPAGRADRTTWSRSDRQMAAQWESRGLTVEGYLLHDVVPERKEACNCGSSTDVDFHLWLADRPAADRGRAAMVVEVSPRTRALHPSWTRAALKQLVKKSAKVRVRGWLTWDNDHPEQLKKTRMTLWEVHPIHEFLILSGTKWQTL
jgi:hypothetical protein